ncbi:MAG: M23 family metallopeptidase, partial [Acetobacteraceae bacterium]|nr:M23 family metallopeptidase [Acetobacteraceae bacterium]
SRGWSVQVTPAQVPQGGLAVLTVTRSQPSSLRSVTGEFLDTPLRFWRRGNAWVALIGIDCSDPAGQHPVVVEGWDSRGLVSQVALTVTVTARLFPSQHLWVDRDREVLASDDTLWDQDLARVRAAKSRSASRPLWTGPFQLPVEGEVTSAYGLLRYVNGRVEGQHSGLDLACEEGTPVRAAARGVVALSATLNITGETVILDHGMGLFSSYCHLSRRLASVGETVEAGEVLGLAGSTGFATGPHLHWSTTVGPVAIDPSLLLREDPLERALPPQAFGPQAGLHGVRSKPPA